MQFEPNTALSRLPPDEYYARGKPLRSLSGGKVFLVYGDADQRGLFLRSASVDCVYVVHFRLAEIQRLNGGQREEMVG